MHGSGACVVHGGGTCMAGGCAWQGGMCGRGRGHAWQGGVHGRVGVCMADTMR